MDWQAPDAVAYRRVVYQDAVVPDIEPLWLIIEPATHLFFDRHAVHFDLLSLMQLICYAMFL